MKKCMVMLMLLGSVLLINASEANVSTSGKAVVPTSASVRDNFLTYIKDLSISEATKIKNRFIKEEKFLTPDDKAQVEAAFLKKFRTPIKKK